MSGGVSPPASFAGPGGGLGGLGGAAFLVADFFAGDGARLVAGVAPAFLAAAFLVVALLGEADFFAGAAFFVAAGVVDAFAAPVVFLAGALLAGDLADLAGLAAGDAFLGVALPAGAAVFLAGPFLAGAAGDGAPAGDAAGGVRPAATGGSGCGSRSLRTSA